MLVDTADARQASAARMPGSQVVRKTARQRAHERGRTSQHSSVSANPIVCTAVLSDKDGSSESINQLQRMR